MIIFFKKKMFAKLPFAKKQHKNKNKAVSDVTDSRVGVRNNKFLLCITKFLNLITY